MDYRQTIAKRVAKEFKNGDYVNLGIGIPTLVSNYIPADINVIIQSENGFLGAGGLSEIKHKDLVNAGGMPASIIPGASFFNSADSFGIIRGGHLDFTVLGALEVDKEGSLANWIIPGKMVPGMGGAMDLVMGAKKVIVAMEHTVKGRPKILNKCSLPLTALNSVDLIITELGVFEIRNKELYLTEILSSATLDDIKRSTEADFYVECQI